MPSPIQVTVHALWYYTPPAALSLKAAERLPAYMTRYARTLGVSVVHAVGGAEDHLHLVFDLPADRTIDALIGELQSATARFLRDTMGLTGFAWRADYAAHSVGAAERDALSAYVAENGAHHAAGTLRPAWEAEMGGASPEGAEALPDWLREAMATDEG